MKKYFPIVAFAAVALASLAMAAFAYLAAEEAARIKFEATADDALNRIESRVGLHLSLLRDTDAFFTARGGQVSGSEFKTYFDALQVDKNLEGLRGLGLIGMARPGEEALLEQAITERLGVEKQIYPPASDGEWRMPVLLGRAARPGKADGHRLRHVQRPATPRGDPCGDRHRRTEGDGPYLAGAADG